jgi:hypothetical protein
MVMVQLYRVGLLRDNLTGNRPLTADGIDGEHCSVEYLGRHTLVGKVSGQLRKRLKSRKSVGLSNSADLSTCLPS